MMNANRQFLSFNTVRLAPCCLRFVGLLASSAFESCAGCRRFSRAAFVCMAVASLFTYRSVLVIDCSCSRINGHKSAAFWKCCFYSKFTKSIVKTIFNENNNDNESGI